jgi:hypothetical protein
MKLRILSVLATLAILGASAATAHAAGQSTSGDAVAQQTAKAPPQVDFPEIGFTFKPVVDGSTVTHEFPVKNDGAGPLAIRQVKTG